MGCRFDVAELGHGVRAVKEWSLSLFIHTGFQTTMSLPNKACHANRDYRCFESREQCSHIYIRQLETQGSHTGERLLAPTAPPPALPLPLSSLAAISSQALPVHDRDMECPLHSSARAHTHKQVQKQLSNVSDRLKKEIP